ncbi:transposase [Nonomuraea sp. LP-02]|uniref:transposase n=1 Tax=Nonomuraea sp. LP-02 TaxID=3097960 RepID=UPI002E3467E8|nr:transposase [Nonomuraea sp. LP-02]MED7931958.1 transposase [Nonomuraea sp. LP-02]
MVIFNELMTRIAGRFGRVEPRRAASAYVRGLLAGLDRKNCWNLAEHAGMASPQKLQRLLRTARLCHPGRAGAAGPAALPARPHLPARTWLAGPGRCRAAGIPDEAGSATTPAPATAMVPAALEAGVPARWVTGDEVHGQDPRLRSTLEERRMGYVPAIAGNRRIRLDGVQVSTAEVTARVADRHWHRYRAGQGAKGPRWYAWAWARIDEDQPDGFRWLLIRRNLTTGEPAMLALALLAAIAAAQPSDTHDRARARARLTLPEIRRLPAALTLTTTHTITDILRWSDWRRRHQATARHCHYQRRFQP